MNRLDISLVEFVILGLAVFRISSLLSNERGPYGILSGLRLLLGEVILRDGTRSGENEISKGLVCLWCVSVWMGALVGIGWLVHPGLTDIICLPLALSSLAVIIDIWDS